MILWGSLSPLDTAYLGVSPVNVKLDFGFADEKTRVTAEKMGTDTLNYLLLRYGYCRTREDKGGPEIWNNLVNANRDRLVTIMQNAGSGKGQIAREIEFIKNEQNTLLSEEEKEQFNAQYNQVILDLKNASSDIEEFDRAKAALETLLSWHLDVSASQAPKGWRNEPFNSRQVLINAK